MANGTSTNIEAKMAEMKMKNLEILKRHREIEEDRQLAQTLSSNNNEKNSTTTMRNTTTKNRTRIISNQNYVQEQNERNQRVLMRRKFDSDRHEPMPQRTQRKRDRIVESSHYPSMPHPSPLNGPDLLEYSYPFQHHQRPTNSQTEIDEPTSAKRLVLANKPATRCATGRSNQQDQRRREERMRRCLLSNNGTNEFHFDVSSMPVWSNHPAPAPLQVYPPAEPIEPPAFIPNFVYPPVPFHSNGTIYFAQAPPLMANPVVPPPPPTPFAPFQFVPLVPRPNDELPPRFRRLKDHDARPISAEVRPQSFHEFSSNHRNNNSRFANRSLPLSAYLNPDDVSHQQQRRRPTNPPRISQQEKHQFPLSLYDPRQYGFDHADEHDEPIEEEWWQETPSETETKTTKTTNVDDSGNSSLSTSIHLKESNFDDEENNLSTNDFTSLPSDVSTSDSNIIESLDKLQQDLKLEEDVEKQLENSSESLTSFTGEPPTYDTAHFMQWAKEKYREELAGRLTAQEIEEHDAVITDDDEDDDFSLPALIQQSQLNFPSLLDDEFDPPNETIDDLKETLKKNLNLDEDILQSNGEVRRE